MRPWFQEPALGRAFRGGAVPPPASVSGRIIVCTLLVLLALATMVTRAAGQEARIRELTIREGDMPLRLVGYGLVIGLDGTGDRVSGGLSAGHTVRSVANLLRRFDVEVPENMLRTRNVAAVLVTAETSGYLRPGGRFDVHVASVGDATSLRGGVLWITPLQAGPTVAPVATAQGALMVSDPDYRGSRSVQTTATLPGGGLLERPLPIPDFAEISVLYLKQPDLVTASRIAARIVEAMGEGSAVVDDPGSISLTLPSDGGAVLAEQLALIGELTVTPVRTARVIIDGRAGTVIAGGNIRIGEAVVSHESMTLIIGGSPPGDVLLRGDLRLDPGVTVQDVAAALHGVAAPPSTVAAVFQALREVGALTAEVTIR